VCHVLIIEDEFVIATYIQTVLEENGATSVEVVATEQQAGPIPVIFITSTPELCEMTGPHVHVLGKPVAKPAIRRAFIEMFPAC
jgi:two-component system, response regulator PdtaR